MDQRLELQARLESICGHVYYQPPSSVSMKYPCIRYSMKEPEDIYADNGRYLTVRKYLAIVIDRDPDSRIPKQVLAAFRYSRMGTPYTADNLNHFPITIKDIHREDVNHE